MAPEARVDRMVDADPKAINQAKPVQQLPDYRFWLSF